LASENHYYFSFLALFGTALNQKDMTKKISKPTDLLVYKSALLGSLKAVGSTVQYLLVYNVFEFLNVLSQTVNFISQYLNLVFQTFFMLPFLLSLGNLCEMTFQLFSFLKDSFRFLVLTCLFRLSGKSVKLLDFPLHFMSLLAMNGLVNFPG
jgi:hypothetical protein